MTSPNLDSTKNWDLENYEQRDTKNWETIGYWNENFFEKENKRFKFPKLLEQDQSW